MKELRGRFTGNFFRQKERRRAERRCRSLEESFFDKNAVRDGLRGDFGRTFDKPSVS
jgi:hypothetical protein